MIKIRIKRVFVAPRAYYIVYVGNVFVGVLINRPAIKELSNLIGHMGWNATFRKNALKFLNEIAVENSMNTEKETT